MHYGTSMHARVHAIAHAITYRARVQTRAHARTHTQTCQAAHTQTCQAAHAHRPVRPRTHTDDRPPGARILAASHRLASLNDTDAQTDGQHYYTDPARDAPLPDTRLTNPDSDRLSPSSEVSDSAYPQ